MAAFAAKHQNATPAWLAIQVDGERASVFFGTLADLMGNKGIPMTPDATEQYECLASNESHGWDLAHLKNTHELRRIQPTKPHRQRLSKPRAFSTQIPLRVMANVNNLNIQRLTFGREDKK